VPTVGGHLGTARGLLDRRCPFVALTFVALKFVTLTFVTLTFVTLTFVTLTFVTLTFVTLTRCTCSDGANGALRTLSPGCPRYNLEPGAGRGVIDPSLFRARVNFPGDSLPHTPPPAPIPLAKLPSDAMDTERTAVPTSGTSSQLHAFAGG